MSIIQSPFKLKDKVTKERQQEVDVDRTIDILMTPKTELNKENNIKKVTPHSNLLKVQENNSKFTDEQEIHIDEVTECGSEKQVRQKSESTFTGAGDHNSPTKPVTSSPTVQRLNTTSDTHANQEAQSDSLTIQKINAKLTAEIINMQRIMSHMDMEDSVNQLKQLNTMELYNEMIKCVERNLAKVIQKKCSCDNSNWEQLNTDLFHCGSLAADVPDDTIETEEVFENTEDLDHINYDESIWNKSNAQKQDPILIKESSLCEYFGRNSKQSEEDYEEDDENVGEDVALEDDLDGHNEEQDNPYEHLTLVTRHVNNKELTRHYEQLEEDYEHLVAQIKEGRLEIQTHINTIGNLREEISEKESQVTELEKKVAVLNKECEELRETLDTLKDEHHYQNIIIEGMKEENDELMGTLETYVHQAGSAKNAIDGLLTKLKRSNSALDKTNLHNTVLHERLNQLKTKTAELEDENVSKFEQIEMLEKKIKHLTEKLEANEEKYKELVTTTQRKLLGQEKIQKQLKLIITKKNFLINAFRSEVAKNAKDGILLSKIQKSEVMINKMLKEKIEGLANVSIERSI